MATFAFADWSMIRAVPRGSRTSSLGVSKVTGSDGVDGEDFVSSTVVKEAESFRADA